MSHLLPFPPARLRFWKWPSLLLTSSPPSPFSTSPNSSASPTLPRVYAAQIATRGRLMQWGAKINSLIDRGQLWRLVTSSFLHVNVGHLLINCISLNSLGPSVETVSGPRGFFAIYFTSAIASTTMSYWLCKAPSIGASGAIFGLIGSVAVYAMRHRGENGRASEDLLGIATVIVLNMLGSFLGRSTVAWFLGPT